MRSSRAGRTCSCSRWCTPAVAHRATPAAPCRRAPGGAGGGLRGGQAHGGFRRRLVQVQDLFPRLVLDLALIHVVDVLLPFFLRHVELQHGAHAAPPHPRVQVLLFDKKALQLRAVVAQPARLRDARKPDHGTLHVGHAVGVAVPRNGRVVDHNVHVVELPVVYRVEPRLLRNHLARKIRGCAGTAGLEDRRRLVAAGTERVRAAAPGVGRGVVLFCHHPVVGGGVGAHGGLTGVSGTGLHDDPIAIGIGLMLVGL
mmetsp:Transcript_18046/g.45149  ORF Transcript_18046/g.45149 Transcript_18046/m.45149 type:complete len:256 (+) Transcript_18046:1582-2349(+)